MYVLQEEMECLRDFTVLFTYKTEKTLTVADTWHENLIDRFSDSVINYIFIYIYYYIYI